MEHYFSPELLAEAKPAELARRAAEHLDMQSMGTAIPATAHWRLPTVPVPELKTEPPIGRTLVEVNVKDGTGVDAWQWFRERDFDDDILRYRTIRLWGDVLEGRSKNLLRQLTEAAPAEEVPT